MKSLFLFFLFFFSIFILKAQEKTKDTLFFNIDKYYTISPTIIPNLTNQTYSQSLERQKQQRNHTKTNGYILFIGDGFLTKGLKPKKILSIKDYIENRKFYLDGTNNQIIDKWKLKDSLTDKYILYFMNGDEFIQPRYLAYHSYYPIGKGENAINNNVKDTLFFKFDNKYVYQSKHEPKSFLLKDGHDVNYGMFFFERIQKVNNLKPREIRNLQKFVRSSKSYYENKTEKLNDLSLSEFFNDYVVFLVKKTHEKTEYIQVKSGFVIE